MRIRVPKRRQRTRASAVAHSLAEVFLSPACCVLASFYKTPGLAFRFRSALLGFRALLTRRRVLPYRDIHSMFVSPMDSVRYFEFDFAWAGVSNLRIVRYLDVSSPRLFPILLTLEKRELQAELLNPDFSDLDLTGRMIETLKLSGRCRLHADLVNTAQFKDDYFDVVTSISVVEHIPDDSQALRKMWRFLKPGGRLFLTVPCASTAYEEYVDRNEYGLLQSKPDGFFFFQRYYDNTLLRQNIFSVTGEPRHYAVYGEKKPGSYHRSWKAKLSDPNYPAWREPVLMGTEYQYYEAIDDMPGIGVIGMEFVKA